MDWFWSSGFWRRFWFHGFVGLGEPRSTQPAGSLPNSISLAHSGACPFSRPPPSEASPCSSLPSPPGLCQSLLLPASPNKQTLNTHTWAGVCEPDFHVWKWGTQPTPHRCYSGHQLLEWWWNGTRFKVLPVLSPQMHDSLQLQKEGIYSVSSKHPISLDSSQWNSETQRTGHGWDLGPQGPTPALPGVATCSRWDTGAPYSFRCFSNQDAWSWLVVTTIRGFCVQGPGFPMSWNPQSCPERTQMSMASTLKNIGWSTYRFLSKLKILWLEIRDTSWTMKMRND